MPKLKNVLALGRHLKRLNKLELYYFSPSLLSKLSVLTRRVKTLYFEPRWLYHVNFTDYVKDIDCSSLTCLRFKKNTTDGEEMFPYIISKIPTLKMLKVEKNYLGRTYFQSFSYDVEKMRFQRVKFMHPDSAMVADVYFHESTVAKKPFHSKHRLVIHKSQFDMLLGIHTGEYSNFSFLSQFKEIDSIRLCIAKDEENIKTLLYHLTSVRCLAIVLLASEFNSFQLPEITFQARSIYFESDSPCNSSFYLWLSKHFTHLQEIYIPENSPFSANGLDNLDIKFLTLTTVSSNDDLTLSFWHKLIRASPKLTKILLPAASTFRDRLRFEFPTILFGLYQQPRYAKNYFLD
ncbi:hypothetical protein DSO57_1015997 [Entomophthora muscae]|uniref:Uncharacterized protein n=1 Tax=Entomophthora muscae TaxID=34485 RepID=A0ACC2SU45_9FUNG|nr:hypothetical protein DSO57_1015997 [Entomophthora muscae]